MKLFKPKILVEILKGPPIHKVKKKCPIVENKVIIEPAKRGRKGHGAWEVPLRSDAIIYDGRFFKRPKIMVMDGANEPIRFSWEKSDDKFADPKPKVNLGRIDVLRIFLAEVINRAGNIKVKYELPVLFWLMFGIQLVSVFLTFLIANRFGVI